jgi:hypothetical protein
LGTQSATKWPDKPEGVLASSLTVAPHQVCMTMAVIGTLLLRLLPLTRLSSLLLLLLLVIM